MRVVLLTQDTAFWRRTQMFCALFTKREIHTHASWNCRERASRSDTEEKKLLNKFIIFAFFAHKKYSRSFIKLWLNHWSHMDYFNDVLTTFLGLEHCSCVAGSESSQISSKISYRFGTTWGWVINDNFHFWVNFPFKHSTATYDNR